MFFSKGDYAVSRRAAETPFNMIMEGATMGDLSGNAEKMDRARNTNSRDRRSGDLREMICSVGQVGQDIVDQSIGDMI